MTKNIECSNLTNPQKSIWLTEQFYKGTDINNICGTVDIDEKIDFDLFKRAINIFIEKNDSFRLKFTIENGEIKQYLSRFEQFDIQMISLDSKKELESLQKNTAKELFALENSLLFKFKIFKFKNGHGGFIVNVHHLISDAATFALIGTDVVKIYLDLIKTGSTEYTQVASYMDFIKSEQEYLSSEKFKKDEEYWNTMFSTVPEIATIPSFEHKINKSFGTSKREEFIIKKDLLESIKLYCQNTKISLFNFFMAVFSIYLSRVSNLNEFVLGTPILNRSNYKERNTSGMFISTVPLKISIDNNLDFTSFVSNVAKDSLSMLRHQKYPYQYLLENLRKQDSTLPGLFSCMVSYQITKAHDVSLDIPYTVTWTSSNTISNDINIHLHDNNDTNSLIIAYDYLIEKYDLKDIEDIHNRILAMINQILNNTSLFLKDIEIVTSEEKQQILCDFNNTEMDYQKDKTIIDLFEDQVKKNPNNVAVFFENQNLTYLELNKKANQIAWYLKENGMSKNDVVGILTNRNLDIYPCLLGVLKAGGVYVLIDYNLPKDRIEYMLRNSNSKILLSTKFINKSVDFDNILNIEELDFKDFYSKNLNLKINPSSPLAIIYTSGSTGRPKGVMLKKQSISNLILSFKKHLNTDIANNFLSFSTISFDMFAVETYLPLLSGKTIVLASEEEQKNPASLSSLIINTSVDFIVSTPSKIELLMLNDSISKCLKNIKIIQLGGEIFTPSLYKKLSTYTSAEIHNGYGPTETTACCSNKKIISTDDINIGIPFCNTSIYVMDQNLNLCPPGVVGELCVSGDCVSFGYVNNKDLTDKYFVKNPYDNNVIYKTGDLARWTRSGELEYFGRNDFQVKIRGLRIEIEEIVSAINTIKSVKTSYVVVKNINGINSICAYIVSEKEINGSYVKNELRKFLPDYMIPNFIIFIDTLPININGKVDTNQLPEIIINTSNEYLAPKNKLENDLCNIWQQLLSLDKVSTDSNFFELGADSLSAIKLSAEIENKFKVKISVKDIFTLTTIESQAEYISKHKKQPVSFTVKKAKKQEYYPLSSAQERIYYACKRVPNSILYNTSGALLIDKVLDKNKVEYIFKKLINIHSSFRTSFKQIDGIPYQFITKDVSFNLPYSYIDNSDIQTIIDDFPRAFDLEKAPLLRVHLYNINNKKTLLLLDSHHIIFDGVSFNILVSDFCKLYNFGEIKPNTIDYVDYSVWENNYNNSNKIKEAEHYWINRFNDYEISSINLPYDYPASNAKNFNGDRISKIIPQELFKKVDHLAKKLKISPYMIHLSLFYVLLYKYTGQENIIVGSPIANREIKEFQNIIGMFVNNIALNIKINSSEYFEDFIYRVKDLVINSLNYQPYPYNTLVKKLNLANTSLFDVVFTYQNATEEKCIIDNVEAEIISANTKTSKFNLLLEIIPDRSTINFEYNTDLFKATTIESIFEHYVFILKQILDNSNVKIDDIEILTENEIKKLNSFNKTDGPINNDTVASIFENQVKKHPNDIAIICDDKTLTYDELNKKANSLAHLLIKRGIGSNDIVCIMTNRSFETIVCMMAILKAGAAFFNVDPTYPIERTKYYLQDSKTRYVLTQKELKNRVKEIENCIEIDLDIDYIYSKNFKNPNVTIEKQDLSYLIYTSGSTGKPKGTMLNQVGLANMVKAMSLVLDYLKDGNRHCIASVTSTPFDIFVYEIIVSLTHGLKIAMANNAEHRNPKLLDQLIRKCNVDVMTVTPSLMKINYDNRLPNTALANVKNMVFGGEPLSEKFVKDLKALADDITIYNIYGPSEITVLSNVQNLNGESEITIGPPIMNTQIHILDKNMKRVPIGVVGEIYISGIQVGLGYIGKPELTKERFLDNPFGTGKMYKSGDIGRWTFDGKVQCLGRIDNQIKLRGLRIELGEIENKIESIEGVSSAVVNKVEVNGREALCGYYVLENNLSENKIKDFLRASLPSYMIPTYMMELKEMPYTINRKIDRKALPLPKQVVSKSKPIDIYVLNTVEKKLLQIWKNLLNTNNLSIDDNFFDIGGDSILAINMQIEAVKYGLDVEYADIFKYPTIRQLSNKSPISPSINIHNFDYSKFDLLLNKNNINNISNIKKANFNNILLIGVTGFLGIHIINEFLENESGLIYCLIRPKDNMNPLERLKETLGFYFNNNYYSKYKNRIKIITGDITKKNLGLSSKDYNAVIQNVDVVINSGAIVKHFGNIEEFEKINVIGTQNTVELCKKHNKRLLHISTISVSGNGEKEESIKENLENLNKKIFKESNLYIGQNITGVYSTTKYKGEIIVLEGIIDGLNASILRIGNITSRYSDGLFQKNIESNAFAQRIKSFIEIGSIPEYSLKHKIELTPVDLCAQAIIKILDHESNCNIFHIYNTKLLSIKFLLDTLKQLKINITPVSNKDMTNIISNILEDESKKKMISGIINDLDNDKNLIYTSNIKLDAEFTEAYLKQIGFEWKSLTADYIKKYINYFKKIGFIK